MAGGNPALAKKKSASQTVSRSGKKDLPKSPVGPQKPMSSAGMSYTGTKKKASVASPKPKAKPSAAKPTPAAASAAPKPKSKPKAAYFGNWKGAAPTAMQARGGARKSSGGGLLGALKRKLGR